MAIERSGTLLQVSEISSISDHSSAATVAANDDLLTEILLRLPVKPLYRFKSVSKQWLSLITNPSFSLLFNSNNPNPNPPSGLLLNISARFVHPEFDFVPLNEDQNASKPPFRTLNFVNDPSGVFILQSCNGLLLCCTNRSSEQRRKYYICNPTTKQFTTLPRLEGGGASKFIYSKCLAFDPSKSPNYTVVCVWSSELGPGQHFQIEVYSSKTGLWRVSGKPFTSQFDGPFGKGVYWNESIHWLSYNEHSFYFNVDQERLEKMPMPHQPTEEDREDMENFRYFGESGDHLHLVEITGLNLTQFTVSEMERDYSKWSVKYIVDFSAISVVFPEMILGYLEPSESYYYAITVLSVVRREKDEDSFLVLRIPGMALRYNFEDKTVKKIYGFDPVEESEEYNGCTNALSFIESLACV